MKKLMIAVCMAVMGVSAANADFIWNWWTTSNAGKPQKTSLKGCSLGIASELKEVQGAQIDLLFNRSKSVKAGAQGAIGFSQTEKLRNGAQFAFVNKAKSAALQLGLQFRREDVREVSLLPVSALPARP